MIDVNQKALDIFNSGFKDKDENRKELCYLFREHEVDKIIKALKQPEYVDGIDVVNIPQVVEIKQNTTAYEQIKQALEFLQQVENTFYEFEDNWEDCLKCIGELFDLTNIDIPKALAALQKLEQPEYEEVDVEGLKIPNNPIESMKFGLHKIQWRNRKYYNQAIEQIKAQGYKIVKVKND